MNPKLALRALVLALLAGSALVTRAAAQCVDTVDATLGGHHDPYLAGQPLGTAHGGNLVPDQSPHLVPLAFVGGELVRFLGVDGQVKEHASPFQKYGTTAAWGPDGDPTRIAVASEALGISGLRMPMNALLGVFSGSEPNKSMAPQSLDFGSAASRDFDLLQPALHQVFFIGDGLREDGITLQAFEVPAGAKTLYLGTADSGAWGDNTGSLVVTVEQEVADVVPYCTAKISSEGCLPVIGYSGYPALSGTHQFDVVCDQVSPGTKSTLFYGHANYGVPFQGGYLCTNVMIKRTPITTAPQTASGAPCSSTLVFDFNSWILSGNDPTLLPGVIIYAQWWMRDPGAWTKTGFSDALQIQLCQ
jgi:hypothetical protein